MKEIRMIEIEYFLYEILLLNYEFYIYNFIPTLSLILFIGIVWSQRFQTRNRKLSMRTSIHIWFESEI